MDKIYICKPLINHHEFQPGHDKCVCGAIERPKEEDDEETDV